MLPAGHLAALPLEILSELNSRRIVVADATKAKLTALAAALPCALGTCRERRPA